MSIFVPSYYPAFRCIADKCRHTCCKGWEIDIDEDTLERYRNVPGEIGQRMNKCIDWERGCFILDEEENCPFLNRQGLCDIILHMGEEALCQICDDHPRFRNFLGDRVEMGLGLCCEAAGQLILSWQEPVKMIPLGEEEGETDEDFLLWRDGVMAMAQDRSMPMTERIDAMLDAHGLSVQVDAAHWAKVLLSLERLEESWAERIAILKSAAWKSLPQGMEIPMEQLMVYLLWRHLAPACDDGDREGRLLYCIVMWQLLCMMHTDDLTELARQYSAEIEYSDENMDAILDEIHDLYL